MTQKRKKREKSLADIQTQVNRMDALGYQLQNREVNNADNHATIGRQRKRLRKIAKTYQNNIVRKNGAKVTEGYENSYPDDTMSAIEIALSKGKRDDESQIKEQYKKYSYSARIGANG